MFAKVQDGVVVACPYTWDDMRRDNPETLFPNEFIESIFVEYGAVKVLTVEKPEKDETQKIVKKTPEFIDGVLTQIWEVIPLEGA